MDVVVDDGSTATQVEHTEAVAVPLVGSSGTCLLEHVDYIHLVVAALDGLLDAVDDLLQLQRRFGASPGVVDDVEEASHSRLLLAAVVTQRSLKKQALVVEEVDCHAMVVAEVEPVATGAQSCRLADSDSREDLVPERRVTS